MLIAHLKIAQCRTAQLTVIKSQRQQINGNAYANGGMDMYVLPVLNATLKWSDGHYVCDACFSPSFHAQPQLSECVQCASIPNFIWFNRQWHNSMAKSVRFEYLNIQMLCMLSFDCAAADGE